MSPVLLQLAGPASSVVTVTTKSSSPRQQQQKISPLNRHRNGNANAITIGNSNSGTGTSSSIDLRLANTKTKSNICYNSNRNGHLTTRTKVVTSDQNQNHIHQIRLSTTTSSLVGVRPGVGRYSKERINNTSITSSTSVQNNYFIQLQKQMQMHEPQSEETKSFSGNSKRLKLISDNTTGISNTAMARPYFVQKLEDKTVIEGQSVELIARVQGATSVSWIRSGKVLPNCPDYQQTFSKSEENSVKISGSISQQGNECCLRIADVFLEDAGRFICKAYNSESGSTTLCSARVTVSERKLFGRKMADKEEADYVKSLAPASSGTTTQNENCKCTKYELVGDGDGNGHACQNQNGTPEISPTEQLQKWQNDSQIKDTFNLNPPSPLVPQSQVNCTSSNSRSSSGSKTITTTTINCDNFSVKSQEDCPPISELNNFDEMDISKISDSTIEIEVHAQVEIQKTDSESEFKMVSGLGNKSIENEPAENTALEIHPDTIASLGLKSETPVEFISEVSELASRSEINAQESELIQEIVNYRTPSPTSIQEFGTETSSSSDQISNINAKTDNPSFDHLELELKIESQELMIQESVICSTSINEILSLEDLISNVCVKPESLELKQDCDLVKHLGSETDDVVENNLVQGNLNGKIKSEIPPTEIGKCSAQFLHCLESGHSDTFSASPDKEDKEVEELTAGDFLSPNKIENPDTSVPAPEIERGPQVMGPSYILALKGEGVHLRIKVAGHPHPIITWSRAGKQLESDDRLQVEEKGEFSSVNIDQVNYDDSGRYVAKVENEFGTVIHTASLSVEGPPEPPSGSPMAAFNKSQNNISVSWSGAPYDGGSALTGYTLLISQDEEEWTLACQSEWLTATISNLDRGSSYRFRVHAENSYGLGPPSHVSIPVVIPGVCTISEHSTNANRLESEGTDEESEAKDIRIRNESYLEFYEKKEELGKGRFGTVFKVTQKTSRKDFASKIVRCIKAADKEKVRQEVEIMNLLRHQKLIELVDAFETSREIVIITEKINGGELFERVVADDFTLTEFDCVGFMRQIIDGVRFIHSKSIIHLDLKPENILCLTRSTYNIKIIDFGLSQKYNNTIPLRVLFGTPEFISPEIINYEPISPASDMWAVGVITYVLLSGLSPFMGDSDSETFANITAADFDFEDDAFASISKDAKEFISSLLLKRHEKRLTAEECLSHKWLAYPEPTKNIVIPTDKLKRFIIRRKWQKTGNAIRALGRITMLYTSRKSSGIPTSVSNTNTTITTSTDSGISLSPTTTNSCADFGSGSEPHSHPNSPPKPKEQSPESKRLLQRQARVDSSSLSLT